MRVIAGKARSLKLKTLDSLDTRPTQDRTKETLFNMLQPYMADCAFLDLFSGSGGIGIEALSRGAGCAVFVEQNPKAIFCIEENLRFTGLDADASVYRGDALSVLRQLEGRKVFDCVFMDPPYNQGLERQILEYLSVSALISEDVLIIVEASLTTDFSYLEELHFIIWKSKKYKTNQHVFIRKMQETDKTSET